MPRLTHRGFDGLHDGRLDDCDLCAVDYAGDGELVRCADHGKWSVCCTRGAAANSCASTGVFGMHA